jgi:hypothetical protein
MSVPYPDDEYVLLLGKLSYSVSYFEWMVLGDLPHISHLPEEFRLEKLAGLSTGQIANAFKNKKALASMPDVRTREWITAASAHLEAIAEARNTILHARPATSSAGLQRLNRWDVKRKQTFMIETHMLEGIIADIDDRIRDMNGRRLI